QSTGSRCAVCLSFLPRESSRLTYRTLGRPRRWASATSHSTWWRRTAVRTSSGRQGLIRRKSAQLEGSVESRNSRCRAARVLGSSQTNRPSARSRRWSRCGRDKGSRNDSRKVSKADEGCTMRVSMGTSGEGGEGSEAPILGRRNPCVDDLSRLTLVHDPLFARVESLYYASGLQFRRRTYGGIGLVQTWVTLGGVKPWAT